MFSGSSREDQSFGGRLTRMNMMLPKPIQIDPAAISAAGGREDEEFPKRDERVPQWGYQETKDFISIRAELERDSAVSKRNKTLWEVVAATMKERGYRRTPDQCKCKWKSLVSRYKGKETSDPDNGRQCPFFDELHAVFTERASNTQELLLESEISSLQDKKNFKRSGGDQSSEEFSEGEDYDEERSDDEKVTRNSNPRKKKAEREKRLRTAVSEKPSLQPNTGYVNSGNVTGSIQEMLYDFLQQQKRIEMQWWESMEQRAHERHKFEQEWQQTMTKLERERLINEQTWKEKEEQRRIREESRAERRDALLTTLLNKLIHENQL